MLNNRLNIRQESKYKHKLANCLNCTFPGTGFILPPSGPVHTCNQGPDSIKRCRLTSIGNPIVEIRRSQDRLTSTMGFLILVRCHLYIESGPRTVTVYSYAKICLLLPKRLPCYQTFTKVCFCRFTNYRNIFCGRGLHAYKRLTFICSVNLNANVRVPLYLLFNRSHYCFMITVITDIQIIQRNNWMFFDMRNSES